MDFKQLALAARTCRRFEEERPLQMADLEWLVDCARLTPCARNAQQLRYSLVGPGETCRRLFGMTKWSNSPCQKFQKLCQEMEQAIVGWKYL